MWVSRLVLGLGMTLGAFLLYYPRFAIPNTMLGHGAVEIPELFSREKGAQLLDVVRTMKDFPAVTADLKFYKTKHEHIGEGIPIGANNTCDHPFLAPSSCQTMCVLPGRIDIGRHYMMYGGVLGLKEPYEKLVSRVQSFGAYIFNLSHYPEIGELFATERFQSAAKNVCPADKQLLEPFQFNFIIQIPGQTVATHIDGAYFQGASRFQFPQWLLAVMVFSGLFKEQFVDQVQVVGYVHDWDDENHERGGDFIYWRDPTGSLLPPTSGSGVAVDGSKTVHAAMVYMPDHPIPMLDKSKLNAMHYLGADKWHLTADGEEVASYATDELRISIVYRARCFADEEARDRYHSFIQGDPEEEVMTLEHIIGVLKADMVARNRYSEQQLSLLSPLNLALALMDEYVKYPLPPRAHATVPWNYCMLGKLAPSLKPLLSVLC